MIVREGNLLRISGPLTQQTVRALYDSGLPNGQPTLTVDLSQVTEVDSAGVSLMLVWLRQAQRNQMQLHITQVPPNLLSLARLYGVADMLAIA